MVKCICVERYFHNIHFSPTYTSPARVPERHGALNSHDQQGQGDLGLPLVSVSQLRNNNQKLTGLACSRHVWVLERFLKISLSEEVGVRKQDGYKIIVAVSNTMVGRLVSWEWVRSHWDSRG